MTLRARLFSCWMKKRPKSLSPTKIIALVFAAIILLGAGLLTLPAASRDGVSCGFLPALFTATSATCVTGLVKQWHLKDLLKRSLLPSKSLGAKAA